MRCAIWLNAYHRRSRLRTLSLRASLWALDVSAPLSASRSDLNADSLHWEIVSYRSLESCQSYHPCKCSASWKQKLSGKPSRPIYRSLLAVRWGEFWISTWDWDTLMSQSTCLSSMSDALCDSWWRSDKIDKVLLGTLGEFKDPLQPIKVWLAKACWIKLRHLLQDLTLS